MEAEVSNVEGIQTSARPLKDDNAVKLNFISSNGPHPLMSTKVVEEMLTRHFGEDWHFTLVDRDGTSQCSFGGGLWINGRDGICNIFTE